ncbi:hypothetical protein Droror1_Dr00017440, partial [Drosera rotundifolia]
GFRRGCRDGHNHTCGARWSSWNHFQCNISEDLIKQTARALVSTGLAKLGYKYVNIDDCWGQSSRNYSQQNLAADSGKFPSGMAALGKYIHGLGLKFGIYTSAGNRTCSGSMPGSLGYEQVDATTFASWGVDYVKYDNCFNDGIDPHIRYKAMSDALRKSGRSIFYNICEWGDMQPALWASKFGNSWRTTDDIVDNWDLMLCIADKNAVYADYAKPGAWNDPDMLEVGNGGMTDDQYTVHFSIWAISKAPLIIGCDVCKITSETLAIIGNEEVIAVNQDPLGVQAKKVRNYGEKDVWAGPLSNNKVVILLVNRKDYNSTMTAYWSDIGIPTNKIAYARDLWLHSNLDTPLKGNLTVMVPPRSCKMFVLTPSS